jgi:predicted ATPase
MIKNIPQFSINNRNVMRRFITLIDELYNHNVKIYCLAVDSLDNLFIKEAGTDEIYDEVNYGKPIRVANQVWLPYDFKVMPDTQSPKLYFCPSSWN